jgi:hypothetical protein
MEGIMVAPVRLWHDIDDPRHRLYCSNKSCMEKRAKFLLGKTEVELELTTSEWMLVALPEGTHQEFKKGHVESLKCANCGTIYYPRSAYDPAE